MTREQLKLKGREGRRQLSTKLPYTNNNAIDNEHIN